MSRRERQDGVVTELYYFKLSLTCGVIFKCVATSFEFIIPHTFCIITGLECEANVFLFLQTMTGTTGRRWWVNRQ